VRPERPAPALVSSTGHVALADLHLQPLALRTRHERSRDAERTTDRNRRRLCEPEVTGGYYDLPDVRDYVCEHLRIPEAAFDEGVNSLLDQTPPPLSPGLSYEGISARRKPLVRTKATGQIHNLIRKT